MAYRFKRDIASVQDGVRAIAGELIDDAIECTGAKRKDVNEVVHSSRKACKKLRGLIRLVRPVFDDYRAENVAFRNAGRGLSALRDGGVLIETYDGLLKTYGDQEDRSKFAPIRRRLTLLQKEATERDDIPQMLDIFRQSMSAARKRVRRWNISGDEFEALEPGVRRSYKACAARNGRRGKGSDRRDGSRVAQTRQGPLVSCAPSLPDLAKADEGSRRCSRPARRSSRKASRPRSVQAKTG